MIIVQTQTTNSIKFNFQGNKALDSGLRLWELFPSKEFDEFYQNYQVLEGGSKKPKSLFYPGTIYLQTPHPLPEKLNI